jgi:hypothetical protein
MPVHSRTQLLFHSQLPVQLPNAFLHPDVPNIPYVFQPSVRLKTRILDKDEQKFALIQKFIPAKQSYNHICNFARNRSIMYLIIAVCYGFFFGCLSNLLFVFVSCLILFCFWALSLSFLPPLSPIGILLFIISHLLIAKEHYLCFCPESVTAALFSHLLIDLHY